MSAQVEPVVDTGELRDHIRAMYREVAEQPDGDFHFELGRPVAERLGYPGEWLDAVPPDALASFAGVGHMLDLAAIEPGDTVLDLGSGSGTDAFVAAHLTGPTGRVIGVDMTDAQLAKARGLRDAAGLAHVQFVEGLIEAPPVDAESIDVVISNGVVNLAPDKLVVFREIHRVLRPGGRLYLADVIVQRELKADVRDDPDLWAACVAGALPEQELAEIAIAAGLSSPRIVERFDCFRDTSAEAKVARDLRVHAVNFFARK